MKLALISDSHCWSINLFPWRLLGKRALGMSNLLLFRLKTFHPSVIKRTISQILAIMPDRVLFAGDLTQTSLPVEFRKARNLFEPIFDKLLAVPGNHDYYTFGAVLNHRFERLFLCHSNIFQIDAKNCSKFEYPWVKKFDNNIKIIGLNGAYPNFHAYGRIPKAQLEKLENEIKISKENNEKVIILNHFFFEEPSDIKARSPHRLLNAQELIDILSKGNKILYIHGHTHKPWIMQSQKLQNVLCVNASAMGMRTTKYEFGLGFYELNIEKSDIKIHRHTPLSDSVWEEKIVFDANNFWE